MAVAERSAVLYAKIIIICLKPRNKFTIVIVCVFAEGIEMGAGGGWVGIYYKLSADRWFCAAKRCVYSRGVCARNVTIKF